ncbi:GNAT family N-acetyltransferase [Pararhizobium sp. PWRC1-1]|uniref:GNAT family N-acetyltransferase n=1 Tax=Pararhizobium sp. PWRC1-1 TaxID=2804566 RepID=UPI003CF92F15
MKRPIIDIIPENASQQDAATILAVLDQHAALHIGAIEEQPDFAILLRDPDTQAVVGGLYGMDGFGWAFVKYLAVPDEYRGQGLGSRLLAEAEAIARARGYIGVWLDTFEFQARPFYEKLGYTVFGELEGAPNAIPRYFLKKRF